MTETMKEGGRGEPDADEIHRVADALDRVHEAYDSVACGDAVGLLKALAEMPIALADARRERDIAVAERDQYRADIVSAIQTIRRQRDEARKALQGREVAIVFAPTLADLMRLLNALGSITRSEFRASLHESIGAARKRWEMRVD